MNNDGGLILAGKFLFLLTVKKIICVTDIVPALYNGDQQLTALVETM